MRVSVITPAYNAERTLGETLRSVQRQSFTGWECLVVDDGSSDATRAVAEHWAGADRRFRLLHQPHSGASAARNLGLSQARSEYILFLDADDLLLPSMLEALSKALDNAPQAAAVYCGWGRWTPAGTQVDHPFFRQSGDLFPTLAGIQPFAIHTCLARREAVSEVGGFDLSLTTCEDWDLWQRVARSGRPFLCVPEVLALYRTQPGSASQSPERMLLDGLRVVGQGGSHDARVPRPAERWLNGYPEALLRPHRYRLLSWSGGLALGQEKSALELCRHLEGQPCPALTPDVVAEAVLQSVLLPTGSEAVAWRALWPRLQAPLAAFVDALEQLSGSPDLASGVMARVEATLCDSFTRPCLVGSTWATDYRPFDALPEALEVPPRAKRARLYAQGFPPLELPVFSSATDGDGALSARVVADAFAAAHAWRLLRGYLTETVLPTLRWEVRDGGSSAFRGPLCLAGGLPSPKAAEGPAALLDRCSWLLFLQELWGRPDWPEARFYEVRPEPDAREAEVPAAVLDLHGPDLELELSEELPNLRLVSVEVSRLRLRMSLGGTCVGELQLPLAPGARFVSASHLRAEITVTAGAELVRAAVREGLLGRGWPRHLSLRERLQHRATAGREEAKLRRPVARFLRRSRGDLGTSASRWAELPPSALDALGAAARTAGEPFWQHPHTLRGGGRVEYRPDVLESSAPEVLEPPGSTLRFSTGRRGPDTASLPILTYHRVHRVPRGAGGNALPFSLAASAFEEHLATLRALGFASATLHDWRAAMVHHRPLAKRAVAFTFDDATADFAELAWPLLKRYGFRALLLVPTDAADSGEYLDRLTGERHRALSWSDLVALQEDGVEVGCHSRSHPFLTRLSPVRVVEELASSRARLQEKLGRPIHTLAYPFGDENALVRHLAGACGFVYGLTCRSQASSLWDDLLSLPRLDASTATIRQLADLLGLSSPSPEVRRAG